MTSKSQISELSLPEKVVEDAIAAQKASVECIKENRYKDFQLEQCLPFVEIVRNFKRTPEQSKEAMDLYQASLLLHYEILTSLTKTVSAMDCAFLEWQQTPITLDIMYRMDRDFKDAIDVFVNTIEESDDIIGIEATRVHNGFYGIISSMDFAALPTHVGDIGHHIGPSYYHICKDDMCLAILEAVSQVGYDTMRRALGMGKIQSPFDVAGIATGASASAMAEILAWEAFTPDMIQDLFQKRFHHWVMAHPYDRPMVGELHINDWLDFATRGASINAPAPRGSGGKVSGVPIDLSAIRFNSKLNNPQRYTYPYTGISVRTTALLRFVDQPCLLAPEPPSIVGMINATVLHPELPMAPVQLCKNCATARYEPAKCNYCISPKLNSML
jgi:hypothetical protein